YRRQSSRPAAAATVRCTVRSISDANIAPAIGVDMERSCPPFDDFSIDHNLADADKARQLEHGVEQDGFEDRPQPTGPSFPQYRFVCNGLQSLLVQLEANIFHLEQPLILLDKGVF